MVFFLLACTQRSVVFDGELHAEDDPCPRTVSFWGDSLVDGRDATEDLPHGNPSWRYWFELESEHCYRSVGNRWGSHSGYNPSAFPDFIAFAHDGYPGETAVDWLDAADERLDGIEAFDTPIDLLYIQLGTNDISEGVDPYELVDTLVALIELARERPLLAQTDVRVLHSWQTDGTVHRQFWQWQNDARDAFADTDWPDGVSVEDGTGPDWDPETMLSDWVHPNLAGQEHIGRTLGARAAQ